MSSSDKDQQQNRQKSDAGSMSGIHTGGAGERESGIIHANPESNVGPAGAPQTSHGSAAGKLKDSQSGISGSASADGVGASAEGAPAEHQRPIGSLADDKPSM